MLQGLQGRLQELMGQETELKASGMEASTPPRESTVALTLLPGEKHWPEERTLGLLVTRFKGRVHEGLLEVWEPTAEDYEDSEGLTAAATWALIEPLGPFSAEHLKRELTTLLGQEPQPRKVSLKHQEAQEYRWELPLVLLHARLQLTFA